MFNNTKPEFGVTLFVKHPIRKDGKFACRYHYKSNGRQIGCLLTQTQIDEEQARGTLIILKGIHPARQPSQPYKFNSQNT